jgi:hypothetical protein
MDVTKLMQKGTRGRKPGSTKKVKISKQDEFLEAKAKMEEFLKTPQGKAAQERQKKIRLTHEEKDKFEETDLQRALRRSKVLQNLVNAGRIKPMFLGNAIIYEDPKLHMRQIELLK